MTVMRRIPLAVVLDEWAAPGPYDEGGYLAQAMIRMNVMPGEFVAKLEGLSAKIAELRDAQVSLTGIFDGAVCPGNTFQVAAGAITLRNGETLVIAYDAQPLC